MRGAHAVAGRQRRLHQRQDHAALDEPLGLLHALEALPQTARHHLAAHLDHRGGPGGGAKHLPVVHVGAGHHLEAAGDEHLGQRLAVMHPRGQPPGAVLGQQRFELVEQARDRLVVTGDAVQGAHRTDDRADPDTDQLALALGDHHDRVRIGHQVEGLVDAQAIRRVGDQPVGLPQADHAAEVLGAIGPGRPSSSVRGCRGAEPVAGEQRPQLETVIGQRLRAP